MKDTKIICNCRFLDDVDEFLPGEIRCVSAEKAEYFRSQGWCTVDTSTDLVIQSSNSGVKDTLNG
jgi:hypothetical protein